MKYSDPAIMTQHANGRVTLNICRSDLASLLLDAARGIAADRCQPMRDEVLRLAEEFAEHERIHFAASSSVYLSRDVQDVLNKPLASTL